MLPLPGFVVGDTHLADGHLPVFAFFKRYTEALQAVGACNVTAMAERPFLIMLMRFQFDGFTVTLA